MGIWLRMETHPIKSASIQISLHLCSRSHAYLPTSRYAVLLGLLHYLQEDSLKSTATRDEIKKFTGLGERTIYTCVREFVECGLINEWRGPFQLKQKFYRINLPAPDSVFEFYGSRKESVSRSQRQSTPNDSKRSNSIIQVDLSAAPAASTALTDCSDAAPTQEVDMTQITNDANNLPLTAETEPALDPGIAQILDLKAGEGGNNLVMEFLTQRGFIHTGGFDGIQIDRDRLLAYLLDKDANTVKGFSALLAEFKADPQIVLPPDEDLKLDLHTNFFDYPYGAQWFWEKCRTIDHNGLILNDKRFAADVRAFMGEHGLKCLDDIVGKVAQMNDELSPRRALSETSSTLQSPRIAS